MSFIRHVIPSRQMLINLRIWLSIIAILSLLGCATKPPEPLTTPAVHQIKVGMTRQEVLNVLGEPQDTTLGKDHQRFDMYFSIASDFEHGRVVATGKVSLRTMQIVYQEDVVKDYSFDHGGASYKRVGSILFVGRKDAWKLFPKINRTDTHLYDLEDWFGDANVVIIDREGTTHYIWFFGDFTKERGPFSYGLDVTTGTDRFIASYHMFEVKQKPETKK